MDKRNFIWITGAGSGIGKALAVNFLEEGYNVFATTRTTEKLSGLKEKYPDDKLIVAECDVADYFSIKGAFDFIASDEINIECLINNAGVTSFSLAEDDDIATIENIISTNLLGSIYSIKLALPSMIENKSGTILNILSVVSKKVFTSASAYSASKAGLLAYTDSLREEVRKHNIRVVNIFPGATSTPIWDEKALEKYSERMMKAEDIAKIIVENYKNKNTAVLEEIVLRPVQGDI